MLTEIVTKVAYLKQCRASIWKAYKTSVWPELIICAVMWNISFFSVHVTHSVFILGLALASIPLFCLLLAKIMLFSKNPRKTLLFVGSAWGAFCLGMQTAWFVFLHVRFPQHYGPKLLFVWFGAVLMFSFLGAAFSSVAFFICHQTRKLINKRRRSDLGARASFVLFFFLTTLLWNPFSWYLSNASFWPTTRLLGYPFFSPMLPLESARSQSSLSDKWQESIVFKWIEPSSYKKSLLAGNSIDFDPYSAGLEIARVLSAAQKEPLSCNENKKLVLLAPESTFPFYIQEHQELIDLWASCLDKNSLFLIGVYRKEGNKLYQSTAVISSAGLERLLDKKHLTPFAESRFTPGAHTKEPNVIALDSTKSLVSIICFEFFSNSGMLRHAKENQISVLFINDSWYPKYFKVLLHNFAKLNSRRHHKPIIYLSHDKSLCIGPLE